VRHAGDDLLGRRKEEASISFVNKTAPLTIQLGLKDVRRGPSKGEATLIE